MSLGQTVALVTGGASGLGAAAVRALRRQGAKVMIADVQEPTTEFLSQVEGSSSSLRWSRVDVTEEDSVNAALDEIQTTFGRPLNACIQCAGVATARKSVSAKGQIHSLEEFERTLRVNTLGTFNVSRLAAQRMMMHDSSSSSSGDDNDNNHLRGCLIQTASIAAYEGQVGQVAYAASKAAIVGMTLPMARDFAPYGIRVMTIVRAILAWNKNQCRLRCEEGRSALRFQTALTAIFLLLPVNSFYVQAPGLFQTPMLEGLPEAVRAELGQTVPCPSRLGYPHEFGQLVVNILENPMLNGSVIRLDGALRMPP